MGRRTKFVKVTKESKALRTLRELSGLSVRKIADRMNVSHTLVSHLELGRANVQKAYVDKFLEALNLSQSDWKIALGGGRLVQEQALLKITDDCLDKMKSLPQDKLVLLNSILSNL